jgi:hypothetical protein
VDPGLPPSVYRAKLAAATKSLNVALAAVAHASSLPRLTSQLASAERLAGIAADRMVALDAPRSVRPEHQRAVPALRLLGTELGTLAEKATSQELCAPSAVLIDLGRMAGPRSVAAAGRAMAAHGYRLPVAIPLAPTHGTPQPGTGTYFTSTGRSGRGELTISNGTSDDAVITLAVGSAARISVFIRHGATYKIPAISDGSYRVYYSSGADWDATAKGFARSCAFSRFDDPLSFTTVTTAYDVRWSTWNLTLQPVFGGTATTSKVNPRDYPH